MADTPRYDPYRHARALEGGDQQFTEAYRASVGGLPIGTDDEKVIESVRQERLKWKKDQEKLDALLAAPSLKDEIQDIITKAQEKNLRQTDARRKAEARLATERLTTWGDPSYTPEMGSAVTKGLRERVEKKTDLRKGFGKALRTGLETLTGEARQANVSALRDEMVGQGLTTAEKFNRVGRKMLSDLNRRKDGLRRQDFGSQRAYDTAVAERGGGAAGGGGGGARDPYEAAQRVMEAKTCFGRLAAMQDKNYILGSGSSLRKAPVELETRSGAMRRAARGLRRVGATTEANQMYGAAAAQKLGEPNIMTEEQRGRIAGQQQQAAGLMQETQEQARRYKDFGRRVLRSREEEDDEKSGGIRKYRGTRPLGPQPGSNIPKAKSEQSNIRQSPRNR